MKNTLRGLLFAAALAASLAALADRRPIEARWEMTTARAVIRTGFPHQFYLLPGDRVPLLFVVDPADAERFALSAVTFEFAPGLKVQEDDKLLEGKSGPGKGYWVHAPAPGCYPVLARIESPAGFTLTFQVDVVCVATLDGIPKGVSAGDPKAPVPVGPVPPGAGPARAPSAPSEYAHIYGLALSFPYNDVHRRYLMRGVRLELWESGGGAAIKVVNASDATGEGNCGLDFEDYVDTTTNTYYSVSNSGSFDYGNVYVGAAGKDLLVREVFQFYSTATGTDATGNLRVSALNGDSGDAQIEIWWNLGHANSGGEHYYWLYNDSVVYLSSSNGNLADEAMHVLVDTARAYRFWRDCTGFQPSATNCHITLSDTGSPYSHGDDFHMTSWDNGYMWYTNTDSIRHEYTHCVHWRMHGNSFPPMAPGDVNHGGCSNSNSSDALVEGFARYGPPLLFRDGAYHWTSTNTAAMAGVYSPYCTSPTPSDRAEWAFGRGLWQAWTDAGSTNAFASCTTNSLYTRDPDYVEDAFMGMVADCGYDHSLWVGFDNNSVNYDTTAPSNPSPISVTPNVRWTNDTTPTWSWTVPADNISGVDGFSVWVTTTTGLPNTSKDIEEVTSYTPPALSDGSNYYFNIRTVDYAGLWNSGSTNQGPIGIDTVQPGAVSNLASTSHTVGAWSTNPSLVMTWTAAADDRSGLDGYGLFTTTSASTPGTYKDIEEVTTYTDTLTSSASGWYFNIRSVDNADNWDLHYVTAGPYYMDNVLPAGVTNLTSTSHSVSTWSNDPTVDFTWTAAVEAHSGLAGYGLYWTTTPGMPSATLDIGAVTAYTQTASTSTSGYYFVVRSADIAGNWQSDYVSAGPYYVDAVAPAAASGLNSATNPVGSCVTDSATVTVTWTSATDAHSGLSGYSYSWSLSAPATPDTVLDLGSGATSRTQTIGYSPYPRYFNLRARDNAGNWSSVVSYGPFTVDDTPAVVADLMGVRNASDANAVDLSWSSATVPEYRIERATTPNFTSYTPFSSTSATWTDTAPPVASVVYYRVKGVNACGVPGS